MTYKLVCFDLDGTLVDGIEFIWPHLHDHIGIDENIRKVHRENYQSQKITYDEWAKSDVELWKKSGATKESILAGLKKISLIPGTNETIKKLKEKKIKIGIISGSLDVVLEKMFPKDTFDFQFINILKFKEDGTIDKVVPTKYDFEHKATALKQIAKKYKVALEETVFVGDNYNDCEAAKAAGLGISFNSKSEKLNNCCNKIIKKKDLREILKYIIKQ